MISTYQKQSIPVCRIFDRLKSLFLIPSIASLFDNIHHNEVNEFGKKVSALWIEILN